MKSLLVLSRDVRLESLGAECEASSRDVVLTYFEKVLLSLVVLDLCLGGNGYLIKLAGLRLREIFFLVCAVWVVVRLFFFRPVKIATPVWALFALYLVTTTFSAALGYAWGHRPAAIVAELKPLAYFPMFLFFVVAIRRLNDLVLVATLLVAGGALVGVLYLLTLASAYTGVVSYSSIYNLLHQSDEFIFRHNPNYGVFIGFLYKGVFYVCIAALFLLFDPFRWTKFLAAALIISIAMTLTRGFAAALICCLLAGMALNGNWRRIPTLAGQALLVLVVIYGATQAENALLVASGDRPPDPSGPGWFDGLTPVPFNLSPGIQRPSDAIRQNDIRIVLEELDPPMIAIGRGLGAPIGKRERIELNYLEILYKQGLPGLGLWGLLFLYGYYLYLKTPRHLKQFGLAYFLSGLFVFIVTASNTFLTGSIGMAVVFIATASLSVLARQGGVDARVTRMGPQWYRWPLFSIATPRVRTA